MSHRHVLLTGPPGIGKTTVSKQVCELLKEKNVKFAGFFTEEVRNGRERMGFDIVTTQGDRGNLARVSAPGASRGPKVGKYTVDVSSFESFALPVFDCLPSSILILDEIGKMESFSKPFLARVQEAFSKPTLNILATIPVTNTLPFVNELRNHKNCLLIEIANDWDTLTEKYQVNRDNRNDLPNEIVQNLLHL